MNVDLSVNTEMSYIHFLQTELLVPPAVHIHEPPNIYNTVVVGNTLIYILRAQFLGILLK